MRVIGRKSRAEVEDLRGRLAQRRQQVRQLRADKRALRAEVKAAQHEAARLRRELLQARKTLRDPFPELEVPDAVRTAIEGVTREELSYLSSDNLMVLARLVREADLAGRPGVVIEAGTALGGSAIVMAAAKDPARPMRVYDVFGMIPPPSEGDGTDAHERYDRIVTGKADHAGDYYGYHEDLRSEVEANFVRHGVEPAAHGVELVRGLFQDTLVVQEPVAVAHLDGDWYESTMTCLTRIAPHLVPGGRFVLDDYYQWSGCRRAADEFFTDNPDFRLERRAKLHAVRVGGTTR